MPALVRPRPRPRPRSRSRSRPSPLSPSSTPSSRPRRATNPPPSSSPAPSLRHSLPANTSSARLTRSTVANPSPNPPPTRRSGSQREASSSTNKPKPKSKKKSPNSMPRNSLAPTPQPDAPETQPSAPGPGDNSDSDLTTLPSLSDAEEPPGAPAPASVPRATVAQARRGARRSLPARVTPPPSLLRTSLRPRVAPVASVATPLSAAVPDKYSLEHMLAEQARRQLAQIDLKRKREQVALFYETHGQGGGNLVLEGFPGGRDLGCMDDSGVLSSGAGQEKKKKKKARTGGRVGAREGSVSDQASKQQSRIEALQVQERVVSEMADKDLGAAARRVIRVQPGCAAGEDEPPDLVRADVLGDAVVDEDALVLLDEVVENINYGRAAPARFPTDLLAWLPTSSSSAPALHALLVQLLMAPLKDVRYPSILAHRTMYVLSDVARQTAGRQLSGAWRLALAQALDALGVALEPGEVPAEERDSGGGEAVVERVGMVLDVAEMLVEWSCLDDNELVWLFGAALQISLDPRAATLRASAGGVVGRLLSRHTGTLGARLMKRMLGLGSRLETWTNRLEMLRLVGPDRPFRRWAALGLLDQASWEGNAAEETVAGLVEWMAQTSDGFTIGPSARELCDTIKHVSSRLHHPTGDAVSRPRPGPGPRSRPDQFRRPFSLHNITDKANDDSSLELSDQQFASAIEVLQICCCGVWDYLVDSRFADEINHQGGNKKNSNGNGKMVEEGGKVNGVEDGVESGLDHDEKEEQEDEKEGKQEGKGNFWVGCMAKDLSRLDRLIKNNMSMSSLSMKINGDEDGDEDEVADEDKDGAEDKHGAEDKDGAVFKSQDEAEAEQGAEDCGKDLLTEGGPEVKTGSKKTGKGSRNEGLGFNQAERVKLKNVVFRLSVALEFMKTEAYLRVKGVDTKGQTKLTKYFDKKGAC